MHRQGPMTDDADRAYVAALRLLARRELAEAQVRTPPRQAQVRRRRDRRRDRRGCAASGRSTIAGPRWRAPAPRCASSIAAARASSARSKRWASTATSPGRRSPKSSRELDENALLEQALDRRLRHGRSLSDAAVFRRVHRYLLGQGFDPGRVSELLRRRAKSL